MVLRLITYKKLQLVAQCLEEKRINLAKSILLNNRQDITNDSLKKEITKHFDIFRQNNYSRRNDIRD